MRPRPPVWLLVSFAWWAGRIHAGLDGRLADDENASRTLVLVPGIGCEPPERLNNVLGQIRALKASETKWDCLAGSFRERPWYFQKKNYTAFIEAMEEFCVVDYVPGGQYADFMREPHPFLVQRGGYTHVVVLLDDVAIGTFDLDEALSIAARESLHVFTPGIYHAHHSEMGPGEEEVRIVPSIETFLTVFRADAWKCWWSLLDPVALSKGWYYDQIFGEWCSQEMGVELKQAVLPRMVAYHMGIDGLLCHVKEKYESFREHTAREQYEHAVATWHDLHGEPRAHTADDNNLDVGDAPHDRHLRLSHYTHEAKQQQPLARSVTEHYERVLARLVAKREG